VTEKTNMDKFISLKGADLINKFLKKFFGEDDEKNSLESNKNNKLAISDYLTNTTIHLFDETRKLSQAQVSSNDANNSKKPINSRFSLKNVMFGEMMEEASATGISNTDLSTGIGLNNINKKQEVFKKGSFIGDFLSIQNEMDDYNDDCNGQSNKNGNSNFYKKTYINMNKPLVIRKNKYGTKFAPYLVYCIKIIDTNAKQGRQDFNNPKLFKNMISLIK